MNVVRNTYSIILLALCMASLSQTASAQTDSPPNSVTAPNGVYIELLGQGICPTVNYERMLFDTTPHNVALRVGAGTWGYFSGDGFVFPLAASYLLGDNHKFEVGAGFVIVTTDSKYWIPYISESS